MSERGFSLIEVLTAVAIVALGATIAIPNYQAWSANSNLKDDAISLKGAIQLARITAITTGAQAAVQLNAPAANQYLLFIDNGNVGGIAGDGVWNANSGECLFSAQGQVANPAPPPALCANIQVPPPAAIQTFNNGVTLSNPPASISFFRSGRRSLPAVAGNVLITLQNGFGLQKIITVRAVGDVS